MQVAKRMKAVGVAAEMIAKATGLTMEQVDAL